VDEIREYKYFASSTAASVKNIRKTNIITTFFFVGIGDKPDDKEFLLRRLSAAVVVVLRVKSGECLVRQE
jgi:hypothetical protein